MNETQQWFEQRYDSRAFTGRMVSMPCTCEHAGGPTHWAAIRNAPGAIAAHLEHEYCLADIRGMEVT